MNKKIHAISYTFAAMAGLSFAVGLAILSDEMRTIRG